MVFHAGTTVSTTFVVDDGSGNLVPIGEPINVRLTELSEESFINLFRAINKERSSRQEQYDSHLEQTKLKMIDGDRE